LVNHRNSHKRSVLRMETSSTAFDEDSPVSAIESTLDLLEDYWMKFQSAQLNIEEKTSETDLPEVLKEMSTTETSYLKTKSVLKELLLLKQKQNVNSEGNNAHKVARDHNVKLPKLEIPKFDGSFNNWMSFRDLFTSMVRDQKTLTDGEKLQYLKPNVFNEAADIVSEYQITDANFEEAWEALEERFENKRLQVKAYLSTLFDQKVMTSENVENLRLLLRTTQKCLSSLKSLGGPVETWDWLLVHMVVIRLDPKTRRYWELTQTSKEVPTYQELITALEKRCNALESENLSSSDKLDED